jgi:hypothetical protein
VPFAEIKKADRELQEQREQEAKTKRKLMEATGIPVDPYTFTDKLDFD